MMRLFASVVVVTLAALGTLGTLGTLEKVTAAARARGQLAEHPVIDVLTHPAIAYATQPTHDAIASLNQRLEDGSARMAFENGMGYLRPLLDALQVPVDSQMLVMSKTGVQGLHTGPENPRAIYFNDSVTIGYIRGAPFLELTVHDPRQGVIFYTLDQKPQARIERRSGCLTCHHGYATVQVPGLLLRSVVVAPDGLPLGQLGASDPDHRTPFDRRFGGWYVTGTHGTMRHPGNTVLQRGETRETMISERTLNRASLAGLFDVHDYASAHSDLVALMVFQHQARMTNLITRAGWDARIAAHEHRLDFTSGPLRDAVDELVDYLLFVDEAPLEAPVAGTSGFAARFAAEGPADSRGRSLRQFDLEHRLFRYPCSYMVYSEAFRALAPELRQAIFRRITDVLSGRGGSPKYARLAEADSRTVLEILRETVPDWPV